MTGATEPVVLEGTSWKAILVAGQPPVAGREPTATFASDRIQGTTGCNQYGGAYTQTGAAIEFGAMMMTLMACEDDVSAVEGRFNAALNGATTASLEFDRAARHRRHRRRRHVRGGRGGVVAGGERGVGASSPTQRRIRSVSEAVGWSRAAGGATRSAV